MSLFKNKPSINLIITLAFSLALVEAIASYVQSSYLAQYITLSQIALVITIATTLTTILTAFHPKAIIKHGNFSTIVSSLIIIIASHLVLSFNHTPWLIIIAFIIRYACLALLFVNLDIILESISKDTETGKTRTKFLTAVSTAWLISPLIMSQVIAGEQYQRMYALGLIIATILLFIVLFNRRSLNQHIHFVQSETNWLHSLNLMLSKGNLRPVFLSALSLQMFYCLAVLYIPLHLTQNLHISWNNLGWIFTVMLLPFVLIQYPAGLLADKYLGEKEMLITGIIILATSCTVIYLTTSNSLWFWAILLFSNRVGAALVEAMQEVYFYKQINVNDLGLINIFRQTRTTGWLLGTIVATIGLSFFNIPTLFLILSGIFILNLLSLATIIDTK